MSEVRQTPSLPDRLFALVQWLLPHHLLSRCMHRIARLEAGWFRKPFTRWFVRHFDVDTSDAVEADPLAYRSFNDFFTRELNPGARPVAPDDRELISPVDGTISQIGEIRGGRIVQAKGQDFSVTELLADRPGLAESFRGGSFATIYLAPYNYHRIHMPITGTLTETIYIPGRLFSVNAATARTVPRLFARNERLACLFDTDLGPVAMILVGALFVGSIETVWAGEITPPHRNVVRHDSADAAAPVVLAKGAEMGRFNMGSTVILLLPESAVGWLDDMRPNRIVRMGEALARRPATTPT